MSTPPRLPSPPFAYNAGYMQQLLRSLDSFFARLTTPGPVNCTTLNATRSDPITGTKTLGLVPSTNLTAGVTAGATSIAVDSTTGFSTSGTALLIKAGAFDKFTYTGKTATTLTGIPAASTGSIANNYSSGDPVSASAVTGDVFCNKAAAYSLHIVP